MKELFCVLVVVVVTRFHIWLKFIKLMGMSCLINTKVHLGKIKVLEIDGSDGYTIM